MEVRWLMLLRVKNVELEWSPEAVTQPRPRHGGRRRAFPRPFPQPSTSPGTTIHSPSSCPLSDTDADDDDSLHMCLHC